MNKYLSKEDFKVFPLSPYTKFPIRESNGSVDVILNSEIPENHKIGVVTGLKNSLFVLDIELGPSAELWKDYQ